MIFLYITKFHITTKPIMSIFEINGLMSSIPEKTYISKLVINILNTNKHPYWISCFFKFSFDLKDHIRFIKKLNQKIIPNATELDIISDNPIIL